MAPTIVTAFARRQAGKVTNYVRTRAQHEYNEASLKLETSIWQTKDFLKGTSPVRVYTDFGKIYGTYKMSRAKDAADAQHKVQARANDRGRIDKAKRKFFHEDEQARRIRIAEAEAEAKRQHQCILLEKKRLAWIRDAPARTTQAARRADHVELTKQRDASRNMPKVTYTLPKDLPKIDYMESARILHPASDDPEERRKRTQTILASILGPERMNLGVGLPSGHSGISDDPILAKYNNEKIINNTLNLHYEYQINQRRQWEEQQRKAAEQEAQRQEKIIIYRHLCSKYDERVVRLVQFGPKFDTAIAKLLQAFHNGDMMCLQQAVTSLVNDILQPVNKIFEDMKPEIVLETQGAQELRNAWPLAGIDQVFHTFNAQNLSLFVENVQCALGYMLQGLRAICQPILAAVPHKNPLTEPPALPFVAQPIPVTFEHYVATTNPQERKQSQGLALEGPNAGKNFSSFADLTNATKAAPTDQPQVPNIIFTPPSFDGSSTPSGKASSPPRSNKVLDMLKYMNDNVLDFQEDVKNLVKGGSISISRRKDCEERLQWLFDYAAGETGLLTGNDANLMKTEIESLIKKIANLRDGKEKNKKTTRDLDVLAHRTLTIWA